MGNKRRGWKMFDKRRYSYGRRDKRSDLLMDAEELKRTGIDVIHVGRGGNSMSLPLSLSFFSHTGLLV